MKRILGLDLGTTSISWLVVDEAENEDEKSAIIKTGGSGSPAFPRKGILTKFSS